MAVGSLQVKICGMRDASLARIAQEWGADFIGMIHHPSSPRHLELRQIEGLCASLPKGTRVGVVVQPDPMLLGALASTGVDHIQIHLKSWTHASIAAMHAQVQDGVQLWIAPAWPPGTPFPTEVLTHASRILVDTHAGDRIGGTGKTGDWAAFRGLMRQHPTQSFVLAGGLRPENVMLALDESGANCIDVNSGVESSPGVKSEARLRELFDVLKDGNERKRSAGDPLFSS